ncbi:hypothetical protein CVS40_6498 [Lucilia cuprina]|nr:hypothetical protein CVS40_6498 [Lucilia cuprina]
MLPRGMSGRTFVYRREHTKLCSGSLRNSYTAALNDIHRDAINTSVSGYRMNVVPEGRTPPIAEIEKNLPRKTRVALAQLRSGWRNRLDAYGSHIDRAVPNICPACGQGPCDTHDTFNCPGKRDHKRKREYFIAFCYNVLVPKNHFFEKSLEIFPNHNNVIQIEVVPTTIGSSHRKDSEFNEQRPMIFNTAAPTLHVSLLQQQQIEVEN